MHLHLLAAPAGDAEMQRFRAELTPQFKRLRPPLTLQGRHLARGKPRDMGDDVQLLPGGLEPPYARAGAAVHCQFTFLPASAPGDGRPR